MGGAELQRLRLTLEPVVLGPDVVTLHDTYVPRGPETLAGADADASALKPDEPDVVEVGVNRYSGVIYAARFFVTRVGFLRSVKRVMVLSSHHLTVVDPYTDEVKERYAYDNIKEIMVATDSGGGGTNVDRAFTIFIGKNIKETYTCRYRQHLLSTYYQLRERASSLRKDGLEIAMSSAPGMTVVPGGGGPGGLPTAPLPGVGTSGMYFDSLFQLCGKTFSMTKLSSTRSTSLSPVKINVLLAVRASSLDRLHADTRATLSSILLIDIVKIQRVTTNSNELVIYYENNRVHRYWSDSREPFIQAIANNLRSWLNVSLFVEEVSDSCEFDALTSTRDIPQPVSFEIPVLKISKNSKNKLQLRLLALTSSAVLERDPETRRTLASHSLNDIFNVVMYPSMSSSLNESAEETEGTCGKFALELKHGRTRRFVCLSATVSRRGKEVGLGLSRVAEVHEQELRNVIRDIGGDTAVPSWLRIAGSSTLLSPKEARSLFLCNMIEMCRMNKLHVSWSTEETPVGCKEGTWASDMHPELEEILLRKLVSLVMIPNLVTKDSLDVIFRHLEQFNRNVPVGNLRQRDRRAFAALMKLLENFKEYAVSQLTSPSNSDSPVPSAEFQVAVLAAIQRLLCTRAVFEEVPNSQYRKGIEIIMELLHSPMEEVSFAAASVIKYMVINYSETRSMKSEQVNRRAVFTKYHCKLFVSRAFDLSKTNRVGRVPRRNLLQYRAGSLDLSRDDGIASRAERSMASALSYSQMGLDYLVVALVLQTLEVCLSSGKKSSPEGVVMHLLRGMKIDEFMRHHTLFLYNRSLSFSIAKCSSILVKVHVLEQPSELVELIQDVARKHGALLWQLYLSLYAHDKAQRRISSQLVALLTHENARSSSVIRNIFPHALLDDIPVEHLEYDEFGRQLPAISKHILSRSGQSSPRRRRLKSAGDDATNGTECGRAKISYGVTTRSRLARNAKCVVLLPEFFDRLWKTYATKDLMWGQSAVEELIRKLEGEVASIDIARLRYQYYLYTDPLGGDRVENEWHVNDSTHGERHQRRQPYPFEFLHSSSDSRLALEVMRGTVSSSNKFAQYMPISFLVNPDTSDAGDSDHGGEDENIESDENSGDESGPPPPTGRRSSLKPVKELVLVKPHEAATVSSAQDVKATKKRRRRAKGVPRWYVSWNANEFRIDYKCLHDEVKVGAYYLTNLLNDRGVLVEDVEGADKFMTLLYYRLLAEDDVHSPRPVSMSQRKSLSSPFSEIDTADIRLLVLKVMIQLYERHYMDLNSLPFLNHLLRVSMMTRGSDGAHEWPLIVRGNIVLFLDRVLSNASNVSRFLREEENVQMILDLLHEVKPLVLSQDALDTESEYELEESDGDFDPSGEDEDYGDEVDHEGEDDSYEEDYADAEEGYLEEEPSPKGFDALEISGVESSFMTTATMSPSHAEQPESSIEQNRFTVVAEHCGAMSGSMIMQTCLSVLSRLIDCHTAEDEGNLFQDVKFPKYGRLIHFEGSAVSPASQIKDRLCEDETLRFLVSILDCPNRVVFKKSLGLIRLLVRHNEAIIPRLHATGLFYYLLRFAQDAEEMAVAARLMSHIHLRQTKQDAHEMQGGESKKGIFSPDPLTQICLKSWLVRLLPVSMVAQLLRHGPKRFAQALFSDSNNPEVVWNSKMRNQMVTFIEKFMARHVDNSGVFSISEDDNVDHEACIALIQYPREVHALQCYQYYLHNLLDEKHFPGWPINDEEAFLESLMDAIKFWVHPDSGRFTRHGSITDNGDSKTLSVKDAILLLDSTALLLRRFPESPAITNFSNLGYVLEALDKCMLELNDGNFNGSRRNIDISDAITKKTSVVQAFGSAIRVINIASTLSEENSLECSSGLGLRVLCASLQLLFDNQEALCGLKTFDVQITTHWVLEALVNVLNQPNGRVSAAAQSLDLLPCLTRFLRHDEDQLATDLSLQIIIEMATSSGEMAEVLLLQLAEHGILWYLTLLLFRYQSSANGGAKDPDRISIGAAKALEQILNARAKEESISIFVKRMQDTIQNLFTQPLIDCLRKSGPVAFLDVLISEVREPHIMWTERMRRELIDIAQRAVHFHSTLDRSGRELHKVYELPSHFLFTAQKEELCVAGIYVNFFNENPQAGIQEQVAGTVNPPPPSVQEKLVAPIRRITGKRAALSNTTPEKRSVAAHVMHGLLTALSNDIVGVRAQPAALEAVLLNRMLPVATAIRHLLQFTPEMDVHVVQSDGILTLLSVLDHDAQPPGFSFATAPLLQLRCIECLHMLSFSGKCLDALATQIPSYVKSMFQTVYRHLTKADATTEGQLARITLQFLGNLCLIPACVDNMVKGMDPVDLSGILPQVWSADPGEVQLLLCLHMIPLKRHTHAATQFAKASVNSQLAATLLSLLSTLVPKSKQGEANQTKSYAARFLSVLSSNPGSGGAISSLLVSSRVWETYGDTTQGSVDDLRRLLAPPYAPSLLKSDHANPHKIG